MYRFRTIENLLGTHQELENQEIYFASLEELNDPMEGLLDIFWLGDEIVWTNFIKHYILCFEHVISLTIISKQNAKITIDDIPITKNHLSYPTPEYKQIIKEILDAFFKESSMKDFAKIMSNRKTPLRRQEILSHLESIHVVSLEIIISVFHKHDLIKKKINGRFNSDILNFNSVNKKLMQFLKSEESLPNLPNIEEVFYSSVNNVKMQLDLITSYNISNDNNSNFVLKEFSEAFLTKIEKIVYPEWYTACFMTECNNSSVWGNYANKHKGVCLIFKTKINGEETVLDLETYYGWNGKPMIGMRPHPFHRIDYKNKHVEIDFFRSLGRLQVCVLESQWYSDENGNKSDCGEPIENSDKWMTNYWKNFYEGATTKMVDWDYEYEQRLIITNMVHDYKSPSSRKLKYDFNDLGGIIFGIKTPKTDKIKIMKIIEEKCKKNKRTDFEFYQAFYNNEKGIIDNKKMALIKFN